MKIQELMEGEVIRDKFQKKLKAKGMYKNPDIEVPKGFERFYTKENPSGKSGLSVSEKMEQKRLSVLDILS